MIAIFDDWKNCKDKYSTFSAGPRVMSKNVKTTKEAKQTAKEHHAKFVVVVYDSGTRRTYKF